MSKQRQHQYEEGSVYFDKKHNRWCGSFYIQDGKRVDVYGKTEKEVWEKLRSAQYEDKQGTLAKGEIALQFPPDFRHFALEIAVSRSPATPKAPSRAARRCPSADTEYITSYDFFALC